MHLTAQGLFPFGENQLACQFELEIVKNTLAFVFVDFSQSHRPEEHGLLDAGQSLAFCHDLIKDFFQQTRNGTENMGMYFSHVVANCLQAFSVIHAYTGCHVNVDQDTLIAVAKG